MIKIQKSRESDLDKIESLIAQAEKDFAKDFLSRVNALKSPDRVEQVRVFIEQGRYDLALQVLDEEDDSSFLLFMFNLWVAASTLQIAMTKDAIQKLQISLFGTVTPIIFDPTDPTNAQNLRNLILEQKAYLSESRRNAFLFILNEGMGRALSGSDLLAYVNKFQGLSQAQIKAVLNYERLLQQNSKQALDRTLRDQSFDRRVLSDRPLTEKQIQKMVDAYIRNQLSFRAQTLARLIVGDLVNEAMQAAAKKAAVDSGIGTTGLVKSWRSMRDRKVRLTHKQHIGLDGQTVGIDEYFVSPSGARLKHPRDRNAPFKETAGCRCWLLVYIQDQI